MESQAKFLSRDFAELIFAQITVFGILRDVRRRLWFVYIGAWLSRLVRLS